MEDVRCPMCGKPNPPDEEVCQFCQARLRPIEGFAFSDGDLYFDSSKEPGKELGRDVNTSTGPELPDWLKSFRQEDDAGIPSEEESLEASIQPGQESSQEEIFSEGVELPAWLHNLGEEAIIEESEIPGEESDNALQGVEELESSLEGSIPDWLSNMRHVEDPSAPDESLSTKQSLAGTDGEPEWLRGMRDSQEDGITAPPDEVKIPGIESDDSGDIFTQSEEEKELSGLPVGTPEGITDWLRQLEEVEGKTEKPEEAVADRSDDSEVPGWLMGAGDEFAEPEEISELEEAASPGEEIQEPKPEPIIPPQEEEIVPAWLSGLEASTELILEERAPEVTGEEEFSSLLEEKSLESETPPVKAEPLPDYFQGSVAPFTEEELELLGEEMPAWVENLPVSETVAGPLEEKIGEDGIERGELPGWLEAIRPSETEEATTSISMVEENARVESAGPLVGLRGVLPAEPEISRINKTSGYSVKLQIPEKQQARITALQELMKTEGKPKLVQDRLVISSQHILRILIFVGLSLTIIWTSFFGGENILLPAFPVEVFDASQAVNGIPSGAPVLLAVDYEPGFSAEMEAASTTVIDHLMLKGAYLTIVSTTPTGPALGERLVNLVNRRGNHYYQDSNQYINLGYIPGGLTGLLAFAEMPQRITPSSLTIDKNTGKQIRVWQDTQLKNLTRLADFSLVLVLTESPDTVRSWVEQVQPVLRQTPIVMVTSAQAEPLIRPYYEGRPQQIKGFVAGVAGGASYEKLTMRLGPAAKQWGAFSNGLLVAILIILVGGAINAIPGFIHPTKRGGEAKS